jgi:hypothetical protein
LAQRWLVLWHSLTGWKFGRRMLSLAGRTSRYAVQIGKRLLKSLNFEAMR